MAPLPQEEGETRPAREEALSPEERRERVLRTAANVLTYRARSSQALYDRLVEKGAAPEDAAWAVARLRELGYLNDADYGRLVVRDLAARGYGPGRIRRALLDKKLDPADRELAMDAYVKNDDKLRRYIDSKFRGQIPDRKLIKRTADGLFRRGFSWEEIQTALRDYTQQMEEEP